MSTMNIPLFKVFMPGVWSLMPKLEATLYSGQIASGDRVPELEARFAEYCDVDTERVVAVNSGTSALHLALLAAKVGPGDEVISTPLTAEPTNLAIAYTGATIVWADIEPGGLNIDPASVEALITERTRAIMAVHYAGIPAAISRLLHIGRQYSVPVIFDAAHAMGAEYAHRSIAGYGDYTIFSLQAIKHISAGDGGILVAPGPRTADYVRRMRWFGIDRSVPRTEVDLKILGFKYAMNEVTATIGIEALRCVYDVVASHMYNGFAYEEELHDVAGITLPVYDQGAKPSFWLFTVFAEDAAGLERKLKEAGIGCGKCHRRNDEHTLFKQFTDGREAITPNLDAQYPQMLHIPCGWWVGEEEHQYIVDTIRGGW